VKKQLATHPRTRLTAVLKALGLATSCWYYTAVPAEKRRRPGPPLKPVDPQVEAWVIAMATINPWYGYQRIAVMCRREGWRVKNREAYRVMKKHGLLQQRRSPIPALYQASKLYELLPDGPNKLWQMDVTYIHIPGHGWWYAVTVIDYYSRYLLTVHLTSSYSAAEVLAALAAARAEAERLHGPLKGPPFLVTDNGPSFIARRFTKGLRQDYTHVRIQYRTPQQLGLLERFHQTMKNEEVYWRLYNNPPHARECLAEFRQQYNSRRPHWALIPPGGGDPATPEEVYAQGVATVIPKWQAWARDVKKKIDNMLTAA
jgi:putative transposase